MTENDRKVGEALCDAMGCLGFGAVLRSSTDEGMTLLAREHFDVVIINLGLPGENGIDGASRIHRMTPDLPIVLITGWLISLDQEAFSNSGITQVLMKPVTLAELEATIKALVP